MFSIFSDPTFWLYNILISNLYISSCLNKEIEQQQQHLRLAQSYPDHFFSRAGWNSALLRLIYCSCQWTMIYLAFSFGGFYPGKFLLSSAFSPPSLPCYCKHRIWQMNDLADLPSFPLKCRPWHPSHLEFQTQSLGSVRKYYLFEQETLPPAWENDKAVRKGKYRASLFSSKERCMT